jgi:hypothetical protein
MADTDIDLTSDLMRRGEEVDIDIDIDIPGGHHDEDYMLDDAEDVAQGHDDVMEDDDSASYVMDDVEEVTEDNTDNVMTEDASAHQNPGFDFVGIGLDHAQVGSSAASLVEANSTPEAEMDDMPYEATPFQNGETHEQQDELPLDITDGYDINPHPDEEGQDQAPLESKSAAQTEVEVANSVVEDDSNYNHTDPSADDLKRGSEVNEADPVNNDPGGVSVEHHEELDSAVFQDTADTAEIVDQPDSAGDHGSDFVYPRVAVLWHDAEYKLIGDSGSEDPESYFFENGHIMTQPLSVFMAELREVVHAELSVEDGLCLAIEDLGLEFDEVCAKRLCEYAYADFSGQATRVDEHLTFGDLVRLYVRLLQNENIEPAETLYVTLSTKLDFSKRLANLLAGAAEGKGFSELAIWNEESPDHETEGLSPVHEGSDNESEGLREGDAEPVDVEAAGDDDYAHTGDAGPVEAEPVEEESTAEPFEANQDEDHENGDGDAAGNPHASTGPASAGNGLVPGSEANAAHEGVGSYESADEHHSDEGVGEDGDIINYTEAEFDETGHATEGEGGYPNSHGSQHEVHEHVGDDQDDVDNNVLEFQQFFEGNTDGTEKTSGGDGYNAAEDETDGGEAEYDAAHGEDDHPDVHQPKERGHTYLAAETSVGNLDALNQPITDPAGEEGDVEVHTEEHAGVDPDEIDYDHNAGIDSTESEQTLTAEPSGDLDVFDNNGDGLDEINYGEDEEDGAIIATENQDKQKSHDVQSAASGHGAKRTIMEADGNAEEAGQESKRRKS